MSRPSEHTQHSAGSAVSLRDVAAAAGVSRMTASRAFKPQAPVSAKLRAKILQVAKEMGYAPDAMVSELMTSFANRRPVQYHETFAVLWWPARWNNLKTKSDFDAEIHRGLTEGARLHGRHVDHIMLGGDLQPRALERMLRARGIQGIILTPPLPAHTPPPALDWTRFSTVVIGSSLDEPGLNRAQAHHHQGIVLALKEAVQRGYCRPCLLVRDDLEERMQRIYSGAFLARGYPPEHIWRQGAPDIPALNEWLRKVSPDVIIGDCDKWFSDLAPEHAARGFISLDVRDSQGAIAGVYQNTARIAMAAIDLLIRARLTHETGIPDSPLVLLNSGLWRDGSSLKRKSVKVRARKKPARVDAKDKIASRVGGGSSAPAIRTPSDTEAAGRLPAKARASGKVPLKSTSKAPKPKGKGAR